MLLRYDNMICIIIIFRFWWHVFWKSNLSQVWKKVWWTWDWFERATNVLLTICVYILDVWIDAHHSHFKILLYSLNLWFLALFYDPSLELVFCISGVESLKDLDFILFAVRNKFPKQTLVKTKHIHFFSELVVSSCQSLSYFKLGGRGFAQKQCTLKPIRRWSGICKNLWCNEGFCKP